MGGGGGGGDTETTVRFADYIEDHHEAFLDNVAAAVAAHYNNSPLASFSAIDVEAGFFGTGYVLASFPSLYDMFGKFMAGLDIEVLFDQTLEDTINGTPVNNLVSAEADRLDTEIEQVNLPRFEVGMRDINSVISSAFVIGRALIDQEKTRSLERFSVDMRYRLVPTAVERWKAHLDWNEKVMRLYAEIMRLYISAEMDIGKYNQGLAVENALWPFRVLDYMRLALGALTGATSTKQDSGGGGAASWIGGAMTIAGAIGVAMLL